MRNEYDIIVAGGGLTGTLAAVAAARNGKKVLVIEQSGCLGGMATNGLVNPFMPYFKATRGALGTEVVAGLFKEVLAMLKRDSELYTEYWDRENHQAVEARRYPPIHRGNTAFNSEVLKWVLDEMTTEAGVFLRFHTFIHGVSVKDGTLSGVKTISKSGQEEFKARFFIDTTGDADLAHLGGFKTVFGREKDGKAQAMTVMFRVTDIDLDRIPKNWKYNDIYRDAVKSGMLKDPGKTLLLVFAYPGRGTLTFNQNELPGYDATNADGLTAAEIRGRKAIREMMTFLKKMVPGFENSRVETIASHVGVRESRRVVGEYVLTTDDLLSCVRFPDTVACGAYPVDIHDPEGKVSDEPEKQLKPDEWYDIPYRSLTVKGASNLLAAGRCLSATHEAAAAVRVMPICSAMGQAAGEAAALALDSGRNAKDIDTDVLRRRLREHNAWLGE